MPASLRFALLLAASTALAGAASVVVIENQDHERARVVAEALAGGRVEEGRASMVRYGCGGCHAIGGEAFARGRVGPPLDGFAGRAEIAGLRANRPEALVEWIRFPQHVSPGNGMPDLGIAGDEARDIATYLYTLR